MPWWENTHDEDEDNADWWKGTGKLDGFIWNSAAKKLLGVTNKVIVVEITQEAVNQLIDAALKGDVEAKKKAAKYARILLHRQGIEV